MASAYDDLIMVEWPTGQRMIAYAEQAKTYTDQGCKVHTPTPKEINDYADHLAFVQLELKRMGTTE